MSRITRRRPGIGSLLLLVPLGLWACVGLSAGPIQEPPRAPDAPGADRDGARGVVHFSMLPTNHMLVRATINGKGPYRLIFDLGAPITLLSNEAGEGSGVIKPERQRSFLFSMRGEAEVAKLQVGSLTAEKVPVIVFDHPALKLLGQAFGQPIDGIIGFTFFARYKTTIDYQVNEMTFEPVDFKVRDLLKELPGRLGRRQPAQVQVLAPSGLWGLQLGPSEGRLDTPGVPVAKVLPGSPAADAGLRPGDVLTTLDGRWTASSLDVFSAAAGAGPGQDVTLTVLRDGKELTLTVRPARGA
ncbi:MAG: PDZ domain-containing protein [Isosphaeraceae bacterium]